MAPKKSYSTNHSRPRHGGKTRHESSNKSKGIIIGICALVVLVICVFFLTRKSGFVFRRATLDKYVSLTPQPEMLDRGADVYIDMSDGMNAVYSDPISKDLLRGVIDKFAAVDGIEFFGLANLQISPIELSHTQLYNFLLNSNNFRQQKAPIEATLDAIVSKNRPALLLSDFEEYKGAVIDRAAYARKYFVEWLAKGNNITFYKWSFTEGGKSKLMFLAVFDDNYGRLEKLVSDAVAVNAPEISRNKYVLGGRDFAYPMATDYLSIKQGGNYHNNKKKDAVTAVLENGGPEDYKSYTQPYATAEGTPGQFAPLDKSIGVFAEYYPLGVKWEAAVHNAMTMQEAGIATEDKFIHLLSKLYVDFGAQDGYSIDGIEVRTFDMQATIEAMASDDELEAVDIENISKPEVNMFLVAGMETPVGKSGWKEIFIDFDSRFNGTFANKVSDGNLFRANVVISKVTPEIDYAKDYFGWEDNQSLANSVVETLLASSSNPLGRVIYTYYLRSI